VVVISDKGEKHVWNAQNPPVRMLHTTFLKSLPCPTYFHPERSRNTRHSSLSY